MQTPVESLDLVAVRSHLRDGHLTPTELVDEVYERIAARSHDNVWIALIPREDALMRARALEEQWRHCGRDPDRLPLYGVPFALKDNIDLAGIPTTAACPDFRYVPRITAPCVARLLAAGAVCVGKTNMDQFATGLNGTRSPYGVPVNPAAPGMIPGGSSSGSAVAVSAGLVSFSLGTDTAGSGRIPAACTNIVGLKPSRGIVSTTGTIPACQSLDCVSVFALGCEDALEVLRVIAGFDSVDPYSRHAPSGWDDRCHWPSFRFATPEDRDLDFCGDSESAALFDEALRHLQALGGERVAVDFSIFRRAASLLYEGPWVAERLTAVGEVLEANPESLHPTTRAILQAAKGYTAAQVFDALHRREALQRQAWAVLADVECLVVPSAPTTFSVQELLDDPMGPNTKLGMYTNFVNLLDLCAVAVPAGFKSGRVPFGVTLVAPAFTEGRLVSVGGMLHRLQGIPAGATRWAPPAGPLSHPIKLAVVGAHLTGQPLNHELRELGGNLWRTCRTAPLYRLYALEHIPPLRPGMVRQADGNGSAIDVEVWKLPPAGAGNFLSRVLPPLALGSVVLEDGTEVKGFLCEDYAVHQARDITSFGGWRSWLASR